MAQRKVILVKLPLPGQAVNFIVVDDNKPVIPDGHITVDFPKDGTQVSIGDFWTGDSWVAQPKPIPPVHYTEDELLALVDAAKDVADLKAILTIIIPGLNDITKPD